MIPEGRGGRDRPEGMCLPIPWRSNGPGFSLCSSFWPWGPTQAPNSQQSGLHTSPITGGWWLCDPEFLASSKLPFSFVQSEANRVCLGKCERLKCQRTWLNSWHIVVLSRVPITVTVISHSPQRYDGWSEGWAEHLLLELPHVHPASHTHPPPSAGQKTSPTPGNFRSSEAV